MTLLENSNQARAVYSCEIPWAVLMKLKVFWLAICAWQIGNDVLLALQYAVAVGEIKDSTSSAGYDHDVVGSKFGPRSVATHLLHGLVELGVGHVLAFAFDDCIG